MRKPRATTAAPPDPARQGHHGGMTAQPPSGETDAEARTRHLAWLNNQTALPPARIRETYEQHGRGVWQAIYGDDPAFTYVPLARVNPRVFHLAEAYDPEDQFVTSAKYSQIADSERLRTAPAALAAACRWSCSGRRGEGPVAGPGVEPDAVTIACPSEPVRALRGQLRPVTLK